MLITFSGFRGKKKLKLLEDSVCFYAVKLMGTRLSVNLEINITSKKIDGNTLGFCTYEDDNVKPRSFEIELSNKIKCVEELFKTLAHEMVHVKQYARGEMKDRYRPAYKQIWMGEEVNTNKVHYYDLPWEIEAHGREHGLFIRFVETYKLHDYFGFENDNKI